MWKKKIKRIAACLLFAALTGVIYCTAAYSLRPDDEGVRTRLEGFYGEKEGSLDAVFVGSSAVYSFVSPLRLWKNTGITSYLYATPNQTVPMIRYILEECRKTQPDALYVIELRPMLASEEDKEAIAADLRRLCDNMPYSLTRMRLIQAMVRPGQRLSYLFDLIKYHDRWKNGIPDRLTLFWGRENPMKGFSPVSAYDRIQGRDWSGVNARIPVSAENEEDLRRLLSYCREEGVRAVFMTTPFALSRQQEKMYNFTGDIVEEYGFEFWDLCRCLREIGLDFDTDYCDFRHTNTLGAMKCTDYLGERLREYARLNQIAVGRADEETERSWQHCLEEYEILEAQSAERIREKIQNGERGQ